MKKVLINCSQFADSFIDDIIVYSSSFPEHLKHLNIVLSEIGKAGLTVKKRKCLFGAKTLKFLGFIIGDGKVLADPEKIEKLMNFPKPQVKKDMRSFMGFINFYRRFVPNLAGMCAGLNETVKNTCPNKICWTEELNGMFQDVKESFRKNVVLDIPKKDYPFVLQTDACDEGLGAVLLQNVEGFDRPIYFISRKLTVREKKYSTIEKENLAIVWAISKLHDYLYGRSFTVRTDHAPLKWLQENKGKVGRRSRWALFLQSYKFKVEYIKGSENYLADLLSRNP